MPTIGLACNIFNEANAVHGLLESASQFFDELFFFHTGPQGAYSTDGTIEILEKWKVRLEFGSIDAGFGAVRTELVERSKCDWVMIMDADERFYRVVPQFTVAGSARYPEVADPKFDVRWRGDLNQGDLLRSIIARPEFDAVRTCRRHWFDHSWKRPCQNWTEIADWQCRILKRNGRTGFHSNVKMHEQVRAENIWQHGASQMDGPYHDHFHCFYKPMEPEQRAHDIRIYNALHEGREIPKE